MPNPTGRPPGRGVKEKKRERAEEVFELRKQGMSLREIGRRLNVDPETARRDVMAVMKELAEQNLESAAEYRDMETARIEALIESLWPKAMSGDHWSAFRILQCSERLAKMRGLDMPTKVAPTDPTGDKEYDPTGGITDEERLARLTAILEAGRNRQSGLVNKPDVDKGLEG